MKTSIVLILCITYVILADARHHQLKSRSLGKTRSDDENSQTTFDNNSTNDEQDAGDEDIGSFGNENEVYPLSGFAQEPEPEPEPEPQPEPESEHEERSASKMQRQLHNAHSARKYYSRKFTDGKRSHGIRARKSA